ncbi:cysteine desulfurase family protein [Geomesophilobacter sediminis]|uniref:cysteine desulfurase n=1 Tax=Geomesophilobacter sediminis TaxID=2798584 RepID=A0A8J7M097_9BACT|nr:aminotransferase class V-fold PLP-dependent enzyme [Geomesophilobacter sediminis]MBJ6724047.1 aminotransferase class V-fold PLP-dependent enzyme [Geomesophilobacter sediminis]
MSEIYLDYNATTPVLPEVLEAMLPFYREGFGNPSSSHATGRRAQQAVDLAREQVAALLHCAPSEVVFTSCATESNNAAIKGVAAALARKGNHIITTKAEHPSVLYPALHLEKAGYRVTCLEVDDEGMFDPADLEKTITPETILISVMLANNETGTIFPVGAVGEIAARHGVYLHCDAVQAVGKIAVDCRELQAGLVSLSGHKLYAPKGVGALVVRQGIRLQPLLHGGGQEKNRRSGTENVAGIVALGQASAIALGSGAAEAARVRELRDRLERGILEAISGVRRNGHPTRRLGNTLSLTFSGLPSDSLVGALDRLGIAVSSGSACSSGALKSAAADGCTQEAHLRFSLGRFSTGADVDTVLDILPGLVESLRCEAGGDRGACR